MVSTSPVSSSDHSARPDIAGTRSRSPEDEILDGAGVGLICGLEVHQQLLTERKLFCHCPTGRYTRTHDATVLRHMRPTLSELGVYDTGRDLLDIGVVPLDNMLPETALMKLSWVLGQADEHDEVQSKMRTLVAGETTVREPHNGYLILQGGLPETEAFISSHWK